VNAQTATEQGGWRRQGQQPCLPATANSLIQELKYIKQWKSQPFCSRRCCWERESSCLFWAGCTASWGLTEIRLTWKLKNRVTNKTDVIDTQWASKQISTKFYNSGSQTFLSATQIWVYEHLTTQAWNIEKDVFYVLRKRKYFKLLYYYKAKLSYRVTQKDAYPYFVR